jgi:hypothetical protein
LSIAVSSDVASDSEKANPHDADDFSGSEEANKSVVTTPAEGHEDEFVEDHGVENQAVENHDESHEDQEDNLNEDEEPEEIDVIAPVPVEDQTVPAPAPAVVSPPESEGEVVVKKKEDTTPHTPVHAIRFPRAKAMVKTVVMKTKRAVERHRRMSKSPIDELLFETTTPSWSPLLTKTLFTKHSEFLALPPDEFDSLKTYGAIMQRCSAMYLAFEYFNVASEDQRGTMKCNGPAMSPHETEQAKAGEDECDKIQPREWKAVTIHGRTGEEDDLKLKYQYASSGLSALIPSLNFAKPDTTRYFNMNRRNTARACSACWLSAMAAVTAVEAPNHLRGIDYAQKFRMNLDPKAHRDDPRIADIGDGGYPCFVGKHIETVHQYITPHYFAENLGKMNLLIYTRSYMSDFEKATTMVGPAAVRHLMDYFWTPLHQKTDAWDIPILDQFY